MTYQPTGPRKCVELLLSEDLAREIVETIEDVSLVVEQSLRLLGGQRGSQPGVSYGACYDEIVDMGIRFYEAHGAWGEEFSTP